MGEILMKVILGKDNTPKEDRNQLIYTLWESKGYTTSEIAQIFNISKLKVCTLLKPLRYG